MQSPPVRGHLCRLIRPAHDAILRVIFPKCLQVLSVPRIIQLLHILQICCSIHNAPRSFVALFHATSLSLFRYSAGTSSSGTSRVVTSETSGGSAFSTP